MKHSVTSPLFSHVIVHDLRTYQDYTDEYTTVCSIDFVFKDDVREKLTVFGSVYFIYGVKMANEGWCGDEYELHYTVADMGNGEMRTLQGITVDEKSKQEIYRIICTEEERREGWLRGHVFSECEMFESLTSQ